MLAGRSYHFWWGAYLAFEVGLSVYDAYTTTATLADPNASAGEKAFTGGAFLAGLALPGAGYGKAANEIADHALPHLPEFAEFGIKTKDDFAKHIKNIMDKPSVGKTDIRTGDQFMLDNDTGTLLIKNADTTKNTGTAYIPDGRKGSPQKTFETINSGN